MSSAGQPQQGIGGMLPTQTNADMTPMAQNSMQQYRNMTAEQLAQLVQRLGNTQQGQVAQRMLQQKRFMPTQAATGMVQPQQPANPMMAAPQAPGQQQQPQMAAGGGMIRRASGGMSLSTDIPFWARDSERESVDGSNGFLRGLTSGRADAIKTTAPSGSYVLPADVVSGLGEGNSLAGARVISDALTSGPWGTGLPRIAHGSGVPRSTAPRPPKAAKGGGVQKGASDGHPIPVMLSHGEYTISPEQVRAIGKGDQKAGWRILDEFVKEARRRTIAKMKSLPGPAR